MDLHFVQYFVIGYKVIHSLTVGLYGLLMIMIDEVLFVTTCSIRDKDLVV